VIEVAAGFERPGATLERLASVLESIGRRESYMALLIEYPAALQRLAALAAASRGRPNSWRAIRCCWTS